MNVEIHSQVAAVAARVAISPTVSTPSLPTLATVSPIAKNQSALESAAPPSPVTQPSERDAARNPSGPPPHRDPPIVTIADPNYIETMRHEGVPAPLILEVVRRCAALHGESAESLCKRVSFIEAFLGANGYDLTSKVRHDFVDLALTQGVAGVVTVRLPAGTELDSACREHLRSFGRAAKALEEAHFAATVMRKVKALKGITYTEISHKAGLAPTFIKAIFADRHSFPINLQADKALLLDSVLRADGDVFFSYVATDQQSAYQQHGTILDKILNRRRFGPELARLLANREGTVAEVAKQATAKSGIKIKKGQVYQWIQSALPSEPMRGVVIALDEILGARGELLALWEHEKPVQRLESYWLSKKDWPEALAGQIEAVIKGNTGAADGAANPGEAPPRWTCESTVQQFQELCESFVGYLINIRKFPADGLSLSLFADTKLVKPYFDFLRQRSNRVNYGGRAEVIARMLLVLYERHLPSLAETVSCEAHWRSRLRRKLTIRKEKQGWITEKETILLTGAEPWEHQLGLAKEFARSFAGRNHFDSELLLGDAAELLFAGIPISRIYAEYADRVANLPILILSRKAAVLARRLASVGLLLAENLHAETIRSLKLPQIKVHQEGVILLDIAPNQFRSRGRGGSAGGLHKELATIPGAALALTRYLREARPLLVQHPKADAGYFFIADNARQPGAQMPPRRLSDDIVLVLGYPPVAHRHLFLFYAFLRGMSLERIAISLQTDAIILERTIKKFAILKNNVAKQVMSKLLTTKGTR